MATLNFYSFVHCMTLECVPSYVLGTVVDSSYASVNITDNPCTFRVVIPVERGDRVNRSKINSVIGLEESVWLQEG